MGHAPSLLALNWKSVAGECVVPWWAGSEAARRRVDVWQCDACMCTPPLQSPVLDAVARASLAASAQQAWSRDAYRSWCLCMSSCRMLNTLWSAHVAS